MRIIACLTQRHLHPRHSLALDRHFLHDVRNPSAPYDGVLRVFDFEGDVLSLGRYHLAPETAPADHGAQLHRRLTGGRAIPCGEGFVGVTLVLPHRAALVASEPAALAPYQVMNRYVRGLMEACRIAGVEPFYPGRDLITVRQRIVAMASFEVDADGALLFEAVLANTRDFSVLPQWLERSDPSGVIKAEMVSPEQTTSFARELGTALAVEELAELIGRGYQQQFGVELSTYTPTPADQETIAAIALGEFGDDDWLRQRMLRSDLDRYGWSRVQLGMFEAYFALTRDGRIDEIMFAGDFIANSTAIERLESELRACPAQHAAIDAVATRVFAEPQNFILGIGEVRTIADTICKGLPA